MQSALSIEIPGDILDALRVPADQAENELLRELAVALYEYRRLPGGKAAALARMTRREFDGLLGGRGIERHYTEAHLQEDLLYARGSE